MGTFKSDQAVRVLFPTVLLALAACLALFTLAYIFCRLDAVEATSEELLLAYRTELAHRVLITSFDAQRQPQNFDGVKFARLSSRQMDNGDQMLQSGNIRGAMSAFSAARYNSEIAENYFSCGKPSCKE